jgi:ribose-phosphate pyrophosphokinase
MFGMSFCFKRAARVAVPSFLVSTPFVSCDERNSAAPSIQIPYKRSLQNLRPVKNHEQELLILSGTGNKSLAGSIAEHLGTKPGAVKVGRFADGEVNIRIEDSCRGKDVYIIQPTSPPVNENLMELLLMISTCRRASAKRITAVIPYYGYARQDRKMSSRVPISAADVARLLESMGVDRVISVDLHSGQIQGFFGPEVPVDNLETHWVGLEYFLAKLEKNDSSGLVVISPDAGGVYRARKFQEGLIHGGIKEAGLAMLIKQRNRPNEIERMDLVGNVQDCDCIIVDDMIDTAGTLCQAALELKKHGARRVYAYATHGLFNGPAVERIKNSELEEVVVTNTIERPEDGETSSKIKQLDVSLLLADAVRRVHLKESLTDLFDNKELRNQ